MNNPLLSIDAARWPKTRRRWTTVIGVLLTINLFLVVVAVRGYTSRPDDVTTAAGPIDAVATDDLTSSAPPQDSGPGQTPDDALVQDEPEGHTALSTSTQPAKTGIAVTDVPTFEASDIVIVNPPDNGGVVHFVFAGTTFRLEPGEYQVLDGCLPTTIVFHKGDELDDFEREISAGVFVFDVNATGWQLVESSPSELDQLVNTCRQASEL